jgi:hypothetical protein
MSWLDDIVDLGSSALNWLGGNGIGSQLARTALTGYGLRQVTNSINKDNEAAQNTTAKIDPGVRLQVDPDTEYRVPVVYGEAVLSGTVTDAVLTNGNSTMWFCITICEKTGKINLGAGADSTFTFNDIYWDDARLIFNTDGVTVAGFIDKSGNVCTEFNGKIQIYCYDGNSNSTSQKNITNYGLASTVNAYSIMPNWTANHAMTDLVFAIIKVDYDATANVKGLGKVKFKMQNSMTQPGDCMYDYMTNSRYGAGIDPTEIYAS